jgi:membrane protein implicated in regulation of membrane protease activity
MNAAFYVVFGLFALSMVVLAVLAVRWGFRRDRSARAELGDRAGPGGEGGR